MAEICVPASNAVSKLTLNIRFTGVGIAKLRLFFAVVLIKLAAAVAGTGVDISLGERAGPPFDERPGSRRRAHAFVGNHLVPRACSVRRESPLYDKSFLDWGRHVDVWLDGVRQERVISFDSDAGAVRVYAGESAETEVRRGVVELRPSAAA